MGLLFTMFLMVDTMLIKKYIAISISSTKMRQLLLIVLDSAAMLKSQMPNSGGRI